MTKGISKPQKLGPSMGRGINFRVEKQYCES